MQITAIISFVVHGALAYLTGTCMWRICTWCVTFEVGSHVLWVRFGWFTSKCSGKMSDRPVADASSPRRGITDRTTFPTTANVNVAATAPLLGDKLRFEYANPMFCCQDVCSFGAFLGRTKSENI